MNNYLGMQSSCGRVLLIASCFPGLLLLRAQDRKPDSAASVAGTVADAFTHLPVAGATIQLYLLNASGGADDMQSSTSGSKGEYAFQDVKPGRRAISIEKAGYATLDSSADGGKSAFVLSAGESARRDFELMPAGSISGRVSDYESGEPLPGLRVMAVSEDYWPGSKRYVPAGAGKSDERGGYVIPNLAPGRYWLEIASVPAASIQTPAPAAAAPRESYGRSYYPGVPSLQMASPVTVTAGQVDRLDIRLRKRAIGRVAGVVQAPPNTPISLQVQQNVPGLYRVIARALIKAGSFQISDLDEGEYVIVATTTGEGPGFFAEQHLSMGAGDIADFNVVLQPGLTLEGSVRLAEGEKESLPAGMWVGLEPVESVRTESDKNVRVSDTGEFRLEGRRPGEHWPFAFSMPAKYQVADIRYGGSSVRGASIRPGSAIGGGKLEFVITSRLGSVRGSVRDAEGKTVSNATVVLLTFPIAEKISPYEIRMTVSEGQGDFAFTAIPPGKYKAVALLGPDARRYRDGEWLRQKASQSEAFQVDAAKVANVSIKP